MADHAATTVTQREPALSIGAATAAVTALLALLTAFGVDLTQGQQVAILGVIAGVGPLVAAFLTRSRVTPNGSIVQVVAGDGTVVAASASPLPNGTPIAPVAPVVAPVSDAVPGADVTPA
jgi:hypothetical protein